MRCVKYAVAGLLSAIAACSASGAAVDDSKTGPEPDEKERDGGAPPIVDAGADRDASSIDLDAERPLTCGDAGFCETKLPKSELALLPEVQPERATA